MPPPAGRGLIAILLVACVVRMAPAADEPVLVVTSDVTLDPAVTYGGIVVRASGVTIDGGGGWLVGPEAGAASPRDYRGVAVLAEGVHDVTLRGIRARGWETGLVIRDGSGWLVEDCDFSDNFHDPDFGWGENGRRGGILLERVSRSTFLRNRARRVWDGCVLVDSSDNLLVDNDFSHCSNTCLKLWTACRNTIRGNTLSHGIRIAPGEVHARDSTSVLIESGSNDNRLVNNDCTHGGDGIFVRVLNGWCSTGNHFEGNDCSHANNNGVECWAPGNVFVRNRANHCSYGFWLGGSDRTRLIDNEASFNGLPDGPHNSPHLPDGGHAGIVFMFGTSSHTLARGNRCVGNRGAGIALVGDLEPGGPRWKAWHWVLEENQLVDNRWGVYATHADWIVASGNRFAGNAAGDVVSDGDVTRLEERGGSPDPTPPLLTARLDGPDVLTIGSRGSWRIVPPGDAVIAGVWDVGDGRLRTGATLDHAFDTVGLHRIGVNITSAGRTEPLWRDVYVVRDAAEIGTETAADWGVEDFHDRVRSDRQDSRARFRAVSEPRLVGTAALEVLVEPYAGFRCGLTHPAAGSLDLPLPARPRLAFWLKAINADVTGWQGGPFLVIHGTDGSRCHVEPRPGRDLMREPGIGDGREGWRLFEVPLEGDDAWVCDGTLPRRVRAITLAFDSWGAPPLRLWIDGLTLDEGPPP